MNSNNVKNKMKLLIAAFCMIFGLSFVSAPMTVHASGTEESSNGSYDLSWLGGEGNGAFSELETEIQETGNSAYRLFMAVGGVGMLLSLIACGIVFMVSGSGQDRNKTLGWFLRIAVGGVIIFGAIAIVGIIQNIGANLL